MSKNEILKAKIRELEERIKYTNSVSEEVMEGIKDELIELKDKLQYMEYEGLNELGF